MPSNPIVRTFARKLIEEGATPTSALRMWRQAGGHIRTQDWYRIWGEARTQIALAPHEQGRSLTARPTESEIATMQTKQRRGIAHEVIVIGRNRAGEVVSRRVEVPTGARPTTRLAAIRRAEQWAEGWLSKEGQKRTDIIQTYGALHVGTIRREPEGG